MSLIVRKEFEFLYSSPVPYKAVVAARGMGKTFAVVQWLRARLMEGRPNRCALFFSSTLRQARMTVEPVMREIMNTLPPEVCTYNRSEYSYTFHMDLFKGPKETKEDKRILYLVSYENAEAKRGSHPDTIILDECGDMPHGMLDGIIIPMLGNAIGAGAARMVAIGTAKGKNTFYNLIQRGRSTSHPEWESYILKATDNGLLKPAALELARSNMSHAYYEQEYMCSFEANVLEGSIFGGYFRKYAGTNVSDDYVYNPSLPVYTSWDLGWRDAVVVWFFQVDTSNTVTFIDYLDGTENDITYYANEVLAKPYGHLKAILPWDAGIGSEPIAWKLNKYGVKNEILRQSSVSSGIDSARLLLKTAKFNKSKCAKGIEHLMAYRYKLDPRLGVNQQEPLHDKHSHAADAFRYAAVGEHIWKRREKSVYGSPQTSYDRFDLYKV